MMAPGCGVVVLALVCAPTASFALPGNAAATTPQLIVSGAQATGASATTTIHVKEARTDAAPLTISIYMPAGYTVNLGQAVGTQIGTVKYKIQLLAFSADTVADVDGTILVADRGSAALQTGATECTGTPTHAAIWQLHTVASGQTFDLPVYVDPTTGTEAAFSSAKLALCLPNPYEQALPGTRAPAGAKIFDARATLSAGVITNPTAAGAYLWRSVTTPWTANGQASNAAGTMEAQGIVTIPSSLSLKAAVKTIAHKLHGKRKVTNSVVLSGKLREGLQGVADARVTVYVNGKTTGSTTTNATGSFSFSRRLGLSNKASFMATGTVPTRETACVSALPAALIPAGCASATLAGYKLSSNTVTATPRR
jgi:hypothetical protein